MRSARHMKQTKPKCAVAAFTLAKIRLIVSAIIHLEQVSIVRLN